MLVAIMIDDKDAFRRCLKPGVFYYLPSSCFAFKSYWFLEVRN